MKTVLLILLTVLSYGSFGQQRMMVFFDKKDASDSYIHLSDRAKLRRSNQRILQDHFDRAVNQDYLELLGQKGRIVSVSRWLNGVVFETELSEKQVLTQFSFVKEVRGAMTVSASPNEHVSKSINYGAALGQVNQINADCLHQDGFLGENIAVAVIDAGFTLMDSLSIFRKAFEEGRVIDTRNFVNPGFTVYSWHSHGTRVASCFLGDQSDNGVAPDPYVGTAPKVDVALYLTEDVTSETEIEEFYLVAALERCDSVGIDIANISLGYLNFDDSTTSHVFDDLDGQTTIASIGVNVAKSKGIAVVTSAGNTGPSHITTPCDADGALCIGAVTVEGLYAPFSSVGPSADGQIKPDVMATGSSAMLINTGTGFVGSGNGTSFSSPIMAGGVACLRQAHPTVSIDELFNAIRESGHQYNSPNELMGYGIPDLCYAHLILTRLEAEKEIKIYPNPANDQLVVESNSAEKEITLFDSFGRLVWSASNQSLLTTIPTANLADGTYVLQISDAQDQRTKVIVLH